MLQRSNQSGQFQRTAKSHKFKNCEDITLENLKLCPIIAQSRTYTYNAAYVIVEYLYATAMNALY